MKYFIVIKQNSERVERKNFQILGGKPLWKHLISELKNEDVYIDTDSPDIIEACKSIDYITCYQRDQKHIDLENDSSFGLSPGLLMVDRFLDTYIKDENEIFVITHVTSPFLRKETIQQAALKLAEGYDSVQACTFHQEYAYYRGKEINWNPTVLQKTQNLEPIVFINGAFFILAKKTFKTNNSRIGKKPYLYKLPVGESIEIDTCDDLELARRWVKCEPIIKNIE